MGNGIIDLIEREFGEDPLFVEQFRSRIFKKFIHEYRYARTLTGEKRERAFEILDRLSIEHTADEVYENEGYGIIWGVLESEAGVAAEKVGD